MISALFDLPKKPRKPRQWRMRVADAGYRCIQFKCPRCGYDTGWIIDDRTVSQNKRGLPCPTCNNLDDGLKSAGEALSAKREQPIGLTHNISTESCS